MAKKRASLKDKGGEILGVKKGQGADILFGLGSDTEAKPASKEDGTAAATTSPQGMPQGEADLEEKLSAEIGAAMGEADMGAELDLDELLSAEAEAAEAEGALPELATTPAAPAPPPAEPLAPTSGPPPAVERPAPEPPPTVTPPLEPEVGLPAVAQPPSIETGAPDLSAPRQARRYLEPVVEDDFDVLAEELSADAAAAARVGAPEAVRLTSEQRARLLRRPSVQKKLAELEREIEGQYDRILRENVSVSKPITDWCHNMLAEARSIVVNLQVEKLAKAEWNVEQVRARLDRADESRKQATWLAPPIIVWGVIWFVIFVYLIFNPTLILTIFRLSVAEDSFLVPNIFLPTLFFGGIGGVAAVFYHLFKYVRERSFDNQYALSYFGKPIMGMILGSIVYLVLFALIRALNILPSGLEAGDIASVSNRMYAAILFVVALASGFKENLAFDLLNRAVKTILGEESETEEVTEPPPALGA